MPANTYIFCYLDILGYKDIVNSFSDDEKAIEGLVDLLYHSIYVMYEGFRDLKTGMPGEEHTKEIIKMIKISLISDSVLVRMPIEDISKEIDMNWGRNAIYTFLFFVSFLILTLINNIGLFLRGGISIGQHFEKNLENEGLFVFSKSLIQAYQYEQKAKTIRILIDPVLIEFLSDNYKDSSSAQYAESFYKDVDGELCLDYYESLTSEGMRHKYFKSLIKAVEMNIERNRNDVNTLMKYITFVKYHNEKVLNLFKLPEYKIDLNLLIK